MGFLSHIRPKAMTTSEAIREMISFGGGSTSTGISVNTDSAMQAMAVQSCVTIISSAFGMLPCNLMQRIGKNRETAENHGLYELLHDQPCEYLTSDKFWGMSAAHVKLQGNFFALKVMVRDEVRELIPLAFSSVEDVIQGPDYSLFYRVRRPSGKSMEDTSTKVDTIPGNRIMHIRGLTLNGFMGLNPIAYARESIGLALATEKHGAKLFGQGTMIGGVLQMAGFFKDRDQAKRFVEEFNEVHNSVENAHKTVLLEQGVTWNKMAMTSVDSQFLEARNFQRQEIVQLMFNMPLGMMTSGDKVATFASSGNFAQDFVTYCLMPLAVSAEKEGRRSLLTDEEKRLKYYIKFEAGALLRGSFEEQMKAFQVAINEEILNPNECRELLDRNPYPGGEQYRTRTSTTKDTGKPADQGAQP